MRIFEPTVEIINQKNDFISIMKHIELIGREAYKSQENITDDSYIKFNKHLINNEHYSVLEHGTIYLKTNNGSVINKYSLNKYSTIKIIEGYGYITTNYRVIIENKWSDDLEYLSEPTEYHDIRITIKLSTQIAISREFNRHRTHSITEESTRFCNYNKNKFDNQLTYSLPHNISFQDIINAKKNLSDIEGYENKYSFINEQMTFNWTPIEWWVWSLSCCELAYKKLINFGWKAQDARYVLPLGTKSDLVHTCFKFEWEDFINKRTQKDVHPDAKTLANKIKKLIFNEK